MAGRGGSKGARPTPLFLAKSILFFLNCIHVWKNIFEIEFWFYSGWNPRSFGSVGGKCVCVCLCDPIGLHDKSIVFLSNIGGFRNRGCYCFFVLQRPNFEWYPRPFWSQKHMPDCRKSHLIFQNFLGEAPRPPPALGTGFHPLTGPPFPKFLNPPLAGPILAGLGWNFLARAHP